MGRRLVRSWVVALLLVASGGAVCAGDGVVALQTADPSCADDSGDRYVDCGNGTVTDNDTGLVWLKDANCIGSAGGGNGGPPGEVDWYAAMGFVAGLSDLPGDDPDDCALEDGSSPGEWRLPSKAEWLAMVAAADALGCIPTITNDQGNGCWDEPFACLLVGKTCSFTGVLSADYWSSTTEPAVPDSAFFAYLGVGGVGTAGKPIDRYVWPVRGGQ